LANPLRSSHPRFHEDKRYEPPSEPTIRRFLQGVDAEAVDAAVYGWLQALSGKDLAVAIDGKTLNGARKVHLLSAFLQQKGMVWIVDAECGEMVRPDVMIFSVFEAQKQFFLYELLAVLNFSQ